MTNLNKDLIQVVEQSPIAVSKHDKDAWLNLFAEDFTVEDPVGSRPHTGNKNNRAALNNFYDTFIAPNNISFDVKNDIVCGSHVMRDLTINIKMSDSFTAEVPVHLLYELMEENGNWKIKRLAAHWELIPMVMQLFAAGLGNLSVLMGLSARMLKHQGLGGMMGFSKAAFSAGKSGKDLLRVCIDKLNNKDKSQFSKSFSHPDKQMIHYPMNGSSYSSENFLETDLGKVEISKIQCAGSYVTATASIGGEEERTNGVIIAQFNRADKKFSDLKFYF